MSEAVDLKSFPGNRTEALAYLYVQTRDLSDKTPSEIQTMYLEAYYELQRDYREKHTSGWLRSEAREG